MSKEPQKSAEKDVRRVEPERTPSPIEEMERFFGNAFPRGWMHPTRWDFPAWAEAHLPFEGRTPKVDLIERDEAFVVHAELPGVDKEDVHISLTEGSVTLEGSTRHEHEEEKGEYYHREMTRGTFSRTLALPGNVDTEKAKATMKDGVLELTLPKLEASKRRSVAVEG